MLKKIPVQQVQLGMYLQSLEGSWLSHPFWRSRFVLREQTDLDALRSSGVAAVWIDVELGADLPDPAHEPAPEPRPTSAVVAPPAPAELPQRVPLQAEIERASQLVNRSRQAVLTLFGEARLGRAISGEQCLPLVEEVAESVARNPAALISLARLKTRDDYTYMHSVAVCALMIALARQLGLDEARTREAGLAGLLHDIGKMMVPTAILNKPGQLSDAEFSVIRTHPQCGYEALKAGGAVPETAMDVCLHHHERIDGTGYPARLKGEEISLLARMGAVCDVYDAITSQRPYKAAWDPAGSLHRMAQWTGQFDPAVFQAFVKSVGIYPVGSLVRLQSGRLAVVVDQHPASLVAPLLRVFYSAKSRQPIPVHLLDLAQPGCADKIVGRESPQDWGFTHSLDDMWRRPTG